MDYSQEQISTWTDPKADRSPSAFQHTPTVCQRNSQDHRRTPEMHFGWECREPCHWKNWVPVSLFSWESHLSGRNNSGQGRKFLWSLCTRQKGTEAAVPSGSSLLGFPVRKLSSRRWVKKHTMVQSLLTQNHWGFLFVSRFEREAGVSGIRCFAAVNYRLLEGVKTVRLT